MIYDFGCGKPADIAAHILPALYGAMSVLFVSTGLAVLGRAFTGNRSFDSSDIFCGWGLAAAFMTLIAVLFVHPLQFVMGILFLAMLVAAYAAVRSGYFKSPFWPCMLILTPIVLVAINLAGIGKWDDFSHWVPNAIYLYRNNGVPGTHLPVSHSAWPGYPYALPFLTYLASHIAGGFLVAGGAMFNYIMLYGFAATLVELSPAAKPRQTIYSYIGWLAFALLAITLFNPSFNASFTMTSQGDTATMVTLAILAVLLWKLIESIDQKNNTENKENLIRVVLISILLVLIKQANIILLLLLAAGFVLTGWKSRHLKQTLLFLPAILIPAFVLRLVWQYHVSNELAGNGFAIKPISQWRWDLFGTVLQAMMHEALRKNGCFILIIATVIAGVASLFRRRGRIENLAIIAGTVNGFYILFLLAAYLGSSFSEPEIRRAASFYRYSTQLGLLNLVLLWLMVPQLLIKIRERAGLDLTVHSQMAWKAFAVISIFSLPLSLLIKPTWLLATPNVEMCQLRQKADYIASNLPPASRLAILEPEGNGMFTYITNFELALRSPNGNQRQTIPWSINEFTAAILPARLTQIEDAPDVDAIYVEPAKRHPLKVAGYDNRNGPLFLLRSDNGWKSVKP